MLKSLSVLLLSTFCGIKLYLSSELGDDQVNGTRYPYLEEERSMPASLVSGGKILSSKPLLGTDESSAGVTGQSNVGRSRRL
jgi:hypothetical protein